MSDADKVADVPVIHGDWRETPDWVKEHINELDAKIDELERALTTVRAERDDERARVAAFEERNEAIRAALQQEGE